HLGAVACLQRGLQVRAVHRHRARPGGAGRGPDVPLAVEGELRRVEPGDGQRVGIPGPGPDVLPLAQGLVEAGCRGSLSGRRRRYRWVNVRLVQVRVPGEPAAEQEHEGRGEPTEPGAPSAGPWGPAWPADAPPAYRR